MRDAAWLAVGGVIVWMGWLFSGEAGMALALLAVVTVGVLIWERRN